MDWLRSYHTQVRFDPVLPEISHWHVLPELIFTIDGCAEIQLQENIIKLRSQDILIVNSFSLHRIRDYTGHIACIILDYPAFSKTIGSDPDLAFRCTPELFRDKTVYQRLRSVLTIFLGHMASDAPDSKISSYGAESIIFLMLVSDFSEPLAKNNSHISTASHVYTAIQYIAANYQKELNVADIAQECHVTDSYLSRLFQKHLDMTPFSFLTKVRLEHSLSLLADTLSLTRIAKETGFPSLRSFNAAFQQEYGALPSEYRKNISVSFRSTSSDLSEALHRLNLQHNDRDYHGPVREYPALNINEKTTVNAFPSGRILFYGPAARLLKIREQKNLESALEDLSATDIYINCIFENRLVNFHRRNGSWYPDFSGLDEVLDFLLSLDLKPFISLNDPADLPGFPHAQAESGSPAVFVHKEERDRWNRLIISLFKHLKDRYSDEELASWHICARCFQEDLPDTAFSEELFDLIGSTCRTIREVCPAVPLSGPDILLSACSEQFTFLYRYLESCSETDFTPDFLALFISVGEDLSGSSEWTDLLIDRSYSYYQSLFRKLTDLLDSMSVHLPLCFTGFSGADCSADLMNDTAFAAAAHAAALCRAANTASMLGSLPLYDDRNIWDVPDAEFHGGNGMKTLLGISKASWYTEYLFRKLKGELLFEDVNVIVVKESEKIRILCYNSGDLKYRVRKYKNTAYNTGTVPDPPELLRIDTDQQLIPDPMNRNQLLKGATLTVRFALTGLQTGILSRCEYIVNHTHGSSYDHWLLTGGCEPSDDDAGYLNRVVYPLVRKSTFTVTDGTWIFERVLEADEVYLTELSPVH